MNTSESKTTAVVILNWNGRHWLERFLPTVERHSALPGVSVVVADNASTDDSLDYLQLQHPDTRIVRLDRNYGFAEGYNRALQQIAADYFVLLNSDVEVTAGWLEPLIALMERTPDAAACMPKLRSEVQRDMFEYAGAAGGFIDRWGYAFCRGRLFDTVEADTGQYDAPAEVFWATGACCIVRAERFREFGGFDKLFFAHMEEIDLCWRWKNAGYTIWFTPESTVYHVGGGMLPQSSPFKTFLNYRNNLLMMYKNLPQKKWRQLMFVRFLMDYASAIYGLIKGKGEFCAILRAHWNFFRLRRKYGRVRRPSAYPTGIYRQSIVYQYFIKKIKNFKDLQA